MRAIVKRFLSRKRQRLLPEGKSCARSRCVRFLYRSLGTGMFLAVTFLQWLSIVMCSGELPGAPQPGGAWAFWRKILFLAAFPSVSLRLWFRPLSCLLPSTSAFAVHIWQAGFSTLGSGLFAGFYRTISAFFFLLMGCLLLHPFCLPPKEQKYTVTWADKSELDLSRFGMDYPHFLSFPKPCLVSVK